MKNVGLLISTLNSGGAERVVSRLSKILSDKYNIYVILFEDTYIEYEYSGELVNLNIESSNNFFKQLLLPFLRAKKLKKIKKELNLDIVISFLDSPNIVNILSKTRKCKTVVSIRNYTFKEEKQNIKTKLLSKVIGRLYKKSDKIIATSKIIEKGIEEKYNIDIHKIQVIYNPYDMTEIEQLSNQEIETENKEFMQNGKNFISVGRIMYQKGFWHLVKAFKLASYADNNIKLIIIGKDYQNGKLEKLIKELDIEDRVRLLGYKENPFKYVSKSQVYIMTSLFEGFPNSLVEAMNCGIPIISADCKSGPREILDIDENINKHIDNIDFARYGVLVPEMEEEENWNPDKFTNSEQILSKAMLTVLNDSEIYIKYKNNAKERAKMYSYEVCKNKYTELIDELIK